MSDGGEKIAVISDIHANLEALVAVLDDIRGQGVSFVVNLGDTVGYGPDPEACIDLVDEACAVNLCGNHDCAVLLTAEDFNNMARKAVDYHRSLLYPEDEQDTSRVRRWEWLRSLHPMHETETFEAMHASPRQPITEYVLPSDPDVDPTKVRDLIAAMSRRVAFVGHTHFPGVLEEDREGFLLPFVIGQRYDLGKKKAIVNVGSVGQPRDRDPRSCYVIFDGLSVAFRRVEYNVEKTAAKIDALPELHPTTSQRLREGR